MLHTTSLRQCLSYVTRLLVEGLVELELDGHGLEGGGRGATPLAAPEVLHLLGRGRDGRSLLYHEAEEIWLSDHQIL